mmetsp:Transcript_12114/g.34311  ORF Transcript_12114/g.34311 Transcript_12114/m.34311 type:complete len:224 (+) Transcript_12114:1965-2636(+)
MSLPANHSVHLHQEIKSIGLSVITRSAEGLSAHTRVLALQPARVPFVAQTLVNALPHGRVALESAPKGNLPDAFAALDARFGLDIRQHVPDGAAGNVAVPLQSLPRGTDHVRRELELLLDRIDDAAPSRVNAKVVKSELEVGDVRLRADTQDLPGNQVGKEENLLAERQDQRPEGGYIGLEAVSCDLHEIFRQVYACVQLVVLLLIHALVVGVVLTHVRPDNV